MTILNDVTVRDGVRYFTATVDGVRYEIPELWSIGYCTTHGGSAIDAAQAWHEQNMLEASLDGSRVDAVARCSFGRGWTLVNSATGLSNGMAYRTRADALATLARFARD